MNKTLITLLAAMGTATAANADTLWSLGFDTIGTGYSLTDSGGNSISDFSNGQNDYFGHSSVGWGNSVDYNRATNPDDTFIDNFFAGQDINGVGASEPLYLTTSAFDISNATDLQFAVDLAEDDDGSNQDWDRTDSVVFEYSVDGGAWTEFSSVHNNGDPFNSAPFVLQGGMETEVTDTFATFSTALAGITGTNMQIRLVWDIVQGDEDLAIDNLTVTGNRLNVVPLPSAAWAGMGLLGAMGVRRRLRK